MPLDTAALWTYVQANPSKAALAVLIVFLIGVIGAVWANAVDKKGMHHDQ